MSARPAYSLANTTSQQRIMRHGTFHLRFLQRSGTSVIVSFEKRRLSRVASRKARRLEGPPLSSLARHAQSINQPSWPRFLLGRMNDEARLDSSWLNEAARSFPLGLTSVTSPGDSRNPRCCLRWENFPVGGCPRWSAQLRLGCSSLLPDDRARWGQSIDSRGSICA